MDRRWSFNISSDRTSASCAEDARPTWVRRFVFFSRLGACHILVSGEIGFQALHVVGALLESGVGIDLVLRVLDLVCNVMHFDAQLVCPLRHLKNFRFRIEGLGPGVWSLGVRAQGLGFKVQGCGVWVAGLESMEKI